MKREHSHQNVTTTSNGGIPFIPFNVAKEILVNLDAQTLFQCAFLCRDWYSLITSPDFISLNSDRISNSRRNKSLLLEIFPRIKGKTSAPRRLYYSMHYDNNNSIRFAEWKVFTWISSLQKKVVGASNGLVCLADNQLHEFILWNPTIRRYVLLPRILTTSQVFGCKKKNAAFGFDHKNNDFKVISLTRHIDDIHYTVLAFSYATWSWKIINSTPPLCFVEDRPPVRINGILHWIAWLLDRYHHFILTFDLANEAFGQISLPSSVTNKLGSISIVETRDSLAVLHTSTTVWSVWVMKQYGARESWTNVVTSRYYFDDDPNQAWIVPIEILAICKKDDIILQMDDGQILRYNPSTTSTKVIGVTAKGVEEDSVSFRYYESLYLLENREDVKCYKY